MVRECHGTPSTNHPPTTHLPMSNHSQSVALTYQHLHNHTLTVDGGYKAQDGHYRRPNREEHGVSAVCLLLSHQTNLFLQCVCVCMLGENDSEYTCDTRTLPYRKCMCVRERGRGVHKSAANGRVRCVLENNTHTGGVRGWRQAHTYNNTRSDHNIRQICTLSA